MRIFKSVLLIALSVLCVEVVAGEPPRMPSAPAANFRPGARTLVVGPKDSSGAPKSVNGKLVILANVSREVSAVSVEIFFDGKSVGTASIKPFRVEYDCSSAAAGEHVVKAVGRGSDGKEVWSASAKVLVENAEDNVPLAPADPSEAGEMVPSPPVIEQSLPPTFQVPDLENTYSNKRYGFSMKYPAGWTAKDETSTMKPKSSNGFWLVFGAPPVVVNIHRTKLDPGTNAEVFAKYNPYVQKWVRKAVADSPAFVTTDGKPESKRVVHRAIFIKDGYAWMANCIDTTGVPAGATEELFANILDSIRPLGSGVTITPVK
ncbi:MAG: Ig-like domain-containing protein [Armatimonadota bacterium]|nr:hypothetical protein [bacterium]